MANVSLNTCIPEAQDRRSTRTPLELVGTHKEAIHHIRFDVIRDMDALARLETSWSELFESHGLSHQMFQTYPWVAAWCRRYLSTIGHGAERSLHIVTAHQGADLVLVMPLVRTCAHGQCRIEWLGHPVSQYGDVVVRRDVNTAQLISAAVDFVCDTAGSDVVVLRKVRADSLVAAVLSKREPSVTAGDIAPFLQLRRDTDFEAFQKRYPAKARKNRRRHTRRLSEVGRITFDVVRQGSQARALVDTALRFKRDWLKSRKLLSVAFADTRIDAFFDDLPTSLSVARSAHCEMLVYVLRCAGKPIAINVAFRCGERLMTHIASYDLAFEKFSPGSLLFERAIADSLESGIETFDLMSPGDAYKLDWTDAHVEVNDYALGLTVRGKAYEAVYIRHLRPAIKRVAVEVPRLVRPITRLLNL